MSLPRWGRNISWPLGQWARSPLMLDSWGGREDFDDGGDGDGDGNGVKRQLGRQHIFRWWWQWFRENSGTDLQIISKITPSFLSKYFWYSFKANVRGRAGPSQYCQYWRRHSSVLRQWYPTTSVHATGGKLKAESGKQPILTGNWKSMSSPSLVVDYLTGIFIDLGPSWKLEAASNQIFVGDNWKATNSPSLVDEYLIWIFFYLGLGQKGCRRPFNVVLRQK